MLSKNSKTCYAKKPFLDPRFKDYYSANTLQFNQKASKWLLEEVGEQEGELDAEQDLSSPAPKMIRKEKSFFDDDDDEVPRVQISKMSGTEAEMFDPNFYHISRRPRCPSLTQETFDPFEVVEALLEKENDVKLRDLGGHLIFNDDNGFCYMMNVNGFAQDELTVEVEGDDIMVRGEQNKRDEKGSIVGKSFSVLLSLFLTIFARSPSSVT
uniref:SHSP domain-containing protein n=1 Tax=Ditylenchus dipsaci TaxID=166011 RepID=A0A915DHN9_9BILA